MKGKGIGNEASLSNKIIITASDPTGGLPITDEPIIKRGMLLIFNPTRGGSEKVVAEPASSPTTTVPSPSVNDVSVTAHEENTEEINIDALKLSTGFQAQMLEDIATG